MKHTLLFCASALLTMVDPAQGIAQWEVDSTHSVGNDVIVVQSSHFHTATTGLVGGCTNSYPLAGDPLIKRTTDGGASWSIVYSGTIGSVRSLCFIDDSVGLATLGDGSLSAILRTTDGGLSWAEVQQGNFIDFNIEDLHFTTNSIGYGVGGDQLARTTDAGLTWTWEEPFVGPSPILQDVHFTSADTGYATGIGGRIHRTTDGAATWDSIGYWEHFDHNGIEFNSASTGFVYGWNDQSGEPMIMRTLDGGNAWMVSTIIPIEALAIRDMAFVDTTTGYAATANGMILKTTDGGATWDTDFPYGSSVEEIYSLSLIDGEGYAFGNCPYFVHNSTVMRVPELAAAPDLAVWPNPVAGGGDLQMVWPTELANSSMQMEIYDGIGHMVMSRRIRSSGSGTTVELDGIRPGLYRLVLRGEHIACTAPVVVQ
ncbi:MAG: hypothetical protein IPI55_08300 [Flavobacteriales bacterium]|nr:hypothetical protein [Flavobacteriales bacterium]